MMTRVDFEKHQSHTKNREEEEKKIFKFPCQGRKFSMETSGILKRKQINSAKVLFQS
jgi:hypothetical protein